MFTEANCGSVYREYKENKHKLSCHTNLLCDVESRNPRNDPYYRWIKYLEADNHGHLYKRKEGTAVSVA